MAHKLYSLHFFYTLYRVSPQNALGVLILCDDSSALPGQRRSPPSRARLTICQEGLGMRKSIRPSKTALRGWKNKRKSPASAQTARQWAWQRQARHIWRKVWRNFRRGAISETLWRQIGQTRQKRQKKARTEAARLETKSRQMGPGTPEVWTLWYWW